MTTLEQQLKQGETITFENDDMMSIELSFRESFGGQNFFAIWMNGKFIKMTKTFKAINNKLEELKEKFDLELTQ